MGLLKRLGFEKTPKKEPIGLDDNNFAEEVFGSDIPVLVDIWSDGCPSCKVIVSSILKLAGKYEGQAKIAQLNVGSGRETARKLNIRGVPTVVFFNKGREVERVSGVRGMHYYDEILQELLEPAQ
jgi:thioredoxin